jgi:hypothetical protein
MQRGNVVGQVIGRRRHELDYRTSLRTNRSSTKG